MSTHIATQPGQGVPPPPSSTGVTNGASRKRKEGGSGGQDPGAHRRTKYARTFTASNPGSSRSGHGSSRGGATGRERVRDGLGAGSEVRRRAGPGAGPGASVGLMGLSGPEVLSLSLAEQIQYAEQYNLLGSNGKPNIPAGFIPPLPPSKLSAGAVALANSQVGSRPAAAGYAIGPPPSSRQRLPGVNASSSSSSTTTTSTTSAAASAAVAGAAGASSSSSSSAHRSKARTGASGRERVRGKGRSRAGDRNGTERQSCDDENGHYIVRLGSDITNRYHIKSLMGEGTFGKVVEAWDKKRRQLVAIKIIRNNPKYRKAASIEMNILEDIEAQEAKIGDSGCIHLRGYFEHRNHVCMVFKKYGLSVFDFMKQNKYRGFRYNHTIDLAYQLIYSVAYLHDMSLIHTDLKPENILFANSETLPTYDHTGRERSYRLPASTAIKLIDFGSATYERDYHSSVVSTRHYRAPEVILGLGWSFPCDIWSIGCILIELLTGEAVFQTHDNVEHLAMMEKLLGKIPSAMALTSDSHAKKYFDDSGKLRWPELAQSKSSVKNVNAVSSITAMFAEDKALLVDLVKQMLVFEPEKRITAREALRHNLFNKVRERIMAYERQRAARAAASSSTSSKTTTSSNK